METLAGGGLFTGGVALDATGVGAIGGVPANALGAAMVAHGVSFAAMGAAGFGKDAKNLYSNIMGGEGDSPPIRIEGMGNGISRDTIIKSATEAKKGGETVVGHALQKHAGRNPDFWGKVKGGPDHINEAAQRHLEEIINAPGDFVKVINNRGITFLEKKLPDGRGVRLNQDGTFKGFIDQ